MSEKLVLIDGHSILNRAFFGLPDLTNSEGLHTNAVYGFLNIMFKILEEEKADYITVAFDVHAPTFRHKMFDGYKGTRKPMAEELRQQVPLMKEMLKAMGICVVELEGYEADDILGTLSCRGEQAGMEVAVISGDRDLLQLATDHVMIRIPKTKKTGTEIENYKAADVQEKYLVTPKEFIDVKALQGDASDNIPGVPGIGEKTASALISQYHSIEAVHDNAESVKPPRAGKNIVEFWDQAVMSKELATIILDAPITYDFADAKIDSIQDLYTEEAFLLCKRLEFKNLLGRFQVDVPKSDAQKHFTLVRERKTFEQIMKRASGKELAFQIYPVDGKGMTTAVADGQLSLFDSIVEKRIEVVAIAFGEEDIYCVQISEELTEEYVLNEIETLDSKQWICPNVKSNLKYLNEECYEDKKNLFFDMSVAAYLLNPLIGEYPYEDVAKNYLGLMLSSKKDYLEKKGITEVIDSEVEKVVGFCSSEVYTAWKSYRILEEELKQQGMLSLFREMEMPLVFVLHDMETEGIQVDAEALKEYGENLVGSIGKLEETIYELAGEKFNINSPKQLGVILFEKLGLPCEKKTKTGYSTSAEVLEKLAMDYPIVSQILEYRQLTKLKSTYADGLANYIDEDQRIRTTFHQTITATGRLSSTEPNLQNIPIRIELGKLIRKVFEPKEGCLFIDSDYSQIELRILAHIAGDERLIEAFQKGQDIHRTTASQVFHVPFEEVTDLQRRNAKAVNFGIVYGISAFGLSQDLNISRKEAQEFIDRYFEAYPKIKAFLDQAVEDAKAQGVSKTLYGRIRPIPELSSSNFMQRQFGERVAMNAPIQGTAADIIKIAMIRVHERLNKEELKSKLILQVHDELLIETVEEEREQVLGILEQEMRGAAELAVELEVGTASGYNWYDAH